MRLSPPPAVGRFRRKPGLLVCRGVTLIEILASVAIVSALAALLLAGLGRTRQAMAATQCVSQMKNIGIAVQQYVTDHGHYPGNGPNADASRKRWFAQVAVYMGYPAEEALLNKPAYEGIAVMKKDGARGLDPHKVKEFLCPARTLWRDANPSVQTGRYGYNPNLRASELEDPLQMRGVPFARISRPSATVMLSEKFGDEPNFASPPATFPPNVYGTSANHRKDNDPQKGPNGPSNYLFCDGHVATFTDWVGPEAFQIQQ